MPRRIPGPFQGMWIEVPDEGDGWSQAQENARYAGERNAAFLAGQAERADALRREQAAAQNAAAQRATQVQLQRERMVGEERQALFAAQERARELAMQYGARGEELAVQNQQFQQRQDLDFRRAASQALGEDLDREMRGQQFQQTGQQRAYEFDTGRQDEIEKFMRQDARRGYEFETGREDDAAKMASQQAMQLYQFEQGRMPSARDQWAVQQERETQKQQMEMQSFYKSLDFKKRQADELEALDNAVSRIMNDPGLADFEKYELIQKIKYKRDVLEEMKQTTQMKGMQQEQQQERQRWERAQKMENMTGAERAKWFQNRTVQLANGRQGWVDDKGNFNEFEPDKFEQMKMQREEAALKQQDMLEQRRITAEEKAQERAWAEEDRALDHWQRQRDAADKWVDHQVKMATTTDELGKKVPDEAKQSELEAKRETMVGEFLAKHGMAATPEEHLNKIRNRRLGQTEEPGMAKATPGDAPPEVMQQQQQQQQQQGPPREAVDEALQQQHKKLLAMQADMTGRDNLTPEQKRAGQNAISELGDLIARFGPVPSMPEKAKARAFELRKLIESLPSRKTVAAPGSRNIDPASANASPF